MPIPLPWGGAKPISPGLSRAVGFPIPAPPEPRKGARLGGKGWLLLRTLRNLSETENKSDETG